MATVTRLNHAVLFVRDPDASAAFYREAFGFEEVAREFEGQAIFMRSPAADNHHDLGLFSVGATAPRPPRGSTGLYHLAWQVGTIDELAEMKETLSRLGALTGASDHGVSKSLYGKDPDGIEFEIMFAVPRDDWADDEKRGVIRTLDLQREVAKYGTSRRA